MLVCRYQQIMHYHMQNEEYGKVIEACKRYGDQEGCLWEQALGYFARKEEDCKAYISEVLLHIDQNNLMPPLLGELLGNYENQTHSTLESVQMKIENADMIFPFMMCHSGADAGTQLDSHSLSHQGLPHQEAADGDPADRGR